MFETNERQENKINQFSSIILLLTRILGRTDFLFEHVMKLPSLYEVFIIYHNSFLHMLPKVKFKLNLADRDRGGLSTCLSII